MEPVGWVVDTVGSRHEGPATERETEIERQPPGDDFASVPGTDGSPQAEERGATGEAHSSGPGEASSHNSVDDLLQRIARQVRARQARSDDNSRRGTSEDSHGGDRRRQVNNSGSSHRQLHQRREHRHPSHEDSTRTSRWGKTSERGASAQPRGAGVGMREASVRTTAEVSAAEANPFVESMWEDASCRQVLQAMFFAQNSAIPAGSTEEHKELEGQEYVRKTRHLTKPSSAPGAAVAMKTNNRLAIAVAAVLISLLVSATGLLVP